MPHDIARIVSSTAVERQQDRALAAIQRQHERTALRMASHAALGRQGTQEVLGLYMTKQAAELMCPDAADALNLIAISTTARIAEEIELHGRRP